MNNKQIVALWIVLAGVGITWGGMLGLITHPLIGYVWQMAVSCLCFVKLLKLNKKV